MCGKSQNVKTKIVTGKNSKIVAELQQGEMGNARLDFLIFFKN